MIKDLRLTTKDLEAILDMGSERVVADLAVKVVEENPDALPDLLSLCWLDKYPLSMRAARAVQLYCNKYPEAIFPFLEDAVEKTINSKIKGVRHNFLKIFAEFIDINKITEPGPLLNKCFEWLLDRNITPAIKIHAMGVIFKLGRNEPEILRELAASIEIIMDESEISMKTCGRKMLKKIEKSLRSEVEGRWTNNLTI
jgi:hypothetical protein